MLQTPRTILIVEPDRATAEIFAESLIRRYHCEVGCVAKAARALEAELAAPHDVVVASLETRDLPGAELARQLFEIAPRPVILTARSLDVDVALLLMGLGLRHVLKRPFTIQDLYERVDAAFSAYTLGMTRFRRHRQVRDFARRLLSQHRVQQERLDVVCRDFVGAHRRLVRRMLSVEEPGGKSATQAVNPTSK